MIEITAEMKKRFLELQSGEEYNDFIREYPIALSDLVKDKEMAEKMTELIRMEPSSCWDTPYCHEELWRKDKKTEKS